MQTAYRKIVIFEVPKIEYFVHINVVNAAEFVTEINQSQIFQPKLFVFVFQV